MHNPPAFADPPAVIDLLRSAGDALGADPLRHGSCVVVPPRGTLLATGDLHDNPVHLRIAHRLARLEASPDNRLVVHEMIHGDRLVNGVDLSHRMLLRVAALVLAHPGQVWPVLANHELAQLIRRGISKGAGNSVQLFEDGLDYVFGDDAGDVAEAISTFIAAMPLALRSAPDATGRAVLCAHSLPGPLAMRHFDSAILERDLSSEDYAAPGGSVYLMTWGRGHEPAQVQALADRWGVTLFCLGHEHVDEGARAGAGPSVLLNSDHERGAVIPIDLAHVPDVESAVANAIVLATVAEGAERAT